MQTLAKTKGMEEGIGPIIYENHSFLWNCGEFLYLHPETMGF